MRNLLDLLAKLKAFDSDDDALLREHVHKATQGDTPPNPVPLNLKKIFEQMDKTTAGISVMSDGTVKIVTYGFKLTKESLEQLGDQLLARAVIDYVATSNEVDELKKAVDFLEEEARDLSRFVADEPGLITHAIKQGITNCTGGQTVDIVHAPEGKRYRYELIVDDQAHSSIVVYDELGQAIMARKENLKEKQLQAASVAERLQGFRSKIGDLLEVLPRLEGRIRYLFDNLDLTELERRLNGKLVGITAGQSEPMILVRREIHEESNKLTLELKQQLIAKHLAGDKIAEDIQRALGIDGDIKAIAKIINATPKTAAKSTAKKPKTKKFPAEP